jgi:cell division ATPase FtsA
MERRVPFKQIDISRAIRAAKSAGIEIDSVRVAVTGDIIITCKTQGEASLDDAAKAFENWQNANPA